MLFENTDHSIVERIHVGSASESKVTLSPRYPDTSLTDSTSAAVKTIFKKASASSYPFSEMFYTVINSRAAAFA